MQQLQAQVTAIQSAFKMLLELKHLYQSVLVEKVQTPVTLADTSGQAHTQYSMTAPGVDGQWAVHSPATVHRVSHYVADNRMSFTPPDLKLYVTHVAALKRST